MSRGKLIVIEGLDGSGKATQAELLHIKIKELGQKVLKVSFPDYKSESSALVKMYLAGKLGTLEEVTVYAASTFYAVDRYASYSTNWESNYNNGYIIIADRYTTSNIVHQMVKLPRDEWDTYIDWVYNYEYQKMQLPRPDQVIYLDVPPDMSAELITKRGNKKDIHEEDLNYLKNCRKSAMYAANKLDWYIIQCTSNGILRPAEDIAQEICGYLQLK